MFSYLYSFICAVAFLTITGHAHAVDDSTRTIITGFNAEAKSVIVHDGTPELFAPRGPGEYLAEVWKVDSLPETNQDGRMPRSFELIPPGAGGAIFRKVSLPPGNHLAVDAGDSAAEGMHQTDTIDFITIISGEIYVVLDSGEETLLQAGDTLVQRGTNHAWENRGSDPCVFTAVMIRPEKDTLNQKH